MRKVHFWNRSPKFHFEDIEFEMHIRHPKRKDEFVFRYVSLIFRKEGCAGNKNVSVTNK